MNAQKWREMPDWRQSFSRLVRHHSLGKKTTGNSLYFWALVIRYALIKFNWIFSLGYQNQSFKKPTVCIGLVRIYVSKQNKWPYMHARSRPNKLKLKKSTCLVHPFGPLHRGAFCQFPFRWIYYCHSCKSTGNFTASLIMLKWKKSVLLSFR